MNTISRRIPGLPPAILLIFFLSGAAALIDQIVWTRALYRIFGVTAPAAGTVLVAFMAGLALGSYTLGRLVDRRRSGLRLYAALELAIAILAPLTAWLFPWLQPLYVWMARATGLDSPWLPVLRGLLCLLVLLPPTTLMGGTLPVLAKGFLRERPGRVVASLYSINTWGAVFGCFIAGFVLLGTLGETRSLFLAASGNLLAALWAWRVAQATSATHAPASAGDAAAVGIAPSDLARDLAVDTASSAKTRLVFAVSFANGFGALALEVLWGRTVGLFTDASVYAFTCIIGVFLIGIAAGSRIAGIYADRLRAPLATLGWLVVLMGAMLVVSLRLFLALMPQRNLGQLIYSDAVWQPVKIMATAAIMIAPVTLLSGACFPIMARLIIRRDGHEGRELGAMYSINTIGGILGAMLAGFAMLPLLHDAGSFLAVAVLYLGSGTLCLLAAGRRGIAAAAAALVLLLAVALVRPDRSLSESVLEGAGDIWRHVESPAGTVTAMTMNNGQKHLLVNGTGMTVLCTSTKLMAHLPLALHPDPASVLVICFGMGTSFRSAALHPVDVTVVELQPAIPQMMEYFHADAAAIRAQPNTHVQIGDGRNYLLLTSQRFSVITIDPAPPMYSAGTVNLYTREFFRLCRDHLDDDGNLCLWIPENSCLESDFRLIVRTMRDVFEHCQLWISPETLGYYLIGSRRPLILRPGRFAAIAANARVRADVAEYNPLMSWNLDMLRNMFLMGTDGIDRYVAPEERLLTDDRPDTEFPWLDWVRLGRRRTAEWMSPDKIVARATPPPPGVFPSP